MISSTFTAVSKRLLKHVAKVVRKLNRIRVEIGLTDIRNDTDITWVDDLRAVDWGSLVDRGQIRAAALVDRAAEGESGKVAVGGSCAVCGAALRVRSVMIHASGPERWRQEVTDTTRRCGCCRRH
ncbi:hypothetical protein AB0J57_32420 [Streptomyces sp. NPDC049837]|uniref:hypothetical protein n=1 Tax=Streptomyces sp. NPDC049837 TaxID=3155277 RepID=UPI0034482877